jgi:hypothetical protein
MEDKTQNCKMQTDFLKTFLAIAIDISDVGRSVHYNTIKIN